LTVKAPTSWHPVWKGAELEALVSNAEPPAKQPRYVIADREPRRARPRRNHSEKRDRKVLHG
jgi:hypothetical protein